MEQSVTLKHVYSFPLVSTSRANSNNGISQVILNLAKFLPAYGYELVDSKANTQLAMYHAGEGEPSSNDAFVAVCHGLYNTSMINAPKWWYEVNRRVIRSAVGAKQLIAPSEWVAEMFRRDMKLNPVVIQWGIDLDQWQTPEPNEGYVLWNKNRPDEVCNPKWMNEAAQHLPTVQFVSTFGKQAPNVKIIGRQYHEDMRQLVKRAGVYLATTKETGDIGTREALAAGIPVVGFRHGAITDIVQHGVNGFLAEVGDSDGLAYGIEYALRYRDVLSANARDVARGYGWEHAAERVAGVFDEALAPESLVKVSVVIPTYNYAHYLIDTIKSAASQKTNFEYEIIIVNDGSTDNTADLLNGIAENNNPEHFRIIHQQNQGVAYARNNGIQAARGEYVICLDADDVIAPDFLQACADALDADPYLGIAFTRLKLHSGQLTDWLSKPLDYNAFAKGFNQVPTCCMFRKADFERMGGFRQYMHPAEDADMWLRLLTFTGKTARCVSQEPLFIYRLHENSASAAWRGANRPDPFTLRAEENQPTWATTSRPFAAPPNNGELSGNVRAYDAPAIQVILQGEGNRQFSLDALENQTYAYWTAESEAPLKINVACGAWLPATYLENALNELNVSAIPCYDEKIQGVLMGCCGGTPTVRITRVETMNQNDFVYVQFLKEVAAPVTVKGTITKTPYGKRTGGEVFLMHKLDAQDKPETYKVLPNDPVAVEVQRMTEIPPEPQKISVVDNNREQDIPPAKKKSESTPKKK